MKVTIIITPKGKEAPRRVIEAERFKPIRERIEDPGVEKEFVILSHPEEHYPELYAMDVEVIK